jgi:formylglycine-generating enzyme required for sulfatase activity
MGRRIVIIAMLVALAISIFWWWRLSENAEKPANGANSSKDVLVGRDDSRSCTQKGVILGRVVSGGLPVPNAEVSLDTNGAVTYVGKTDLTGSFTATAPQAFVVIVEAPSFELFLTEPKHPPECNPMELVVELPPSVASATAGTSAKNGSGWYHISGSVEMHSTETATVVLIGAFRPYHVVTAGGKFELEVEERPPYVVHAVGIDWFTRPVEVFDERESVTLGLSNRLRRTYSDEKRIVWRFSSPAGVYLMEREATFELLNACVDGAGCRGRQMTLPEGGAFLLAECTPSPSSALPVDCLTHEDAKALCKWLGARLPTEKEWSLEFTASHGTYPRYRAPKDCRLENMLQATPDRSQVIGSEMGRGLITAMCAGTATALGCTHSARSASGLCDLAGNLGEWSFTKNVAMGVPARAFQVSTFRFHGFPAISGMIGVRCAKDVDAAGPNAVWHLE